MFTQGVKPENNCILSDPFSIKTGSVGNSSLPLWMKFQVLALNFLLTLSP